MKKLMENEYSEKKYMGFKKFLHQNILIVLSFYLRKKQNGYGETERKKETANLLEKALIHWFIPQMCATTTAGAKNSIQELNKVGRNPVS